MTPAERQAKKLAARQTRFYKLVHRWAFTNSQKNPKKFATLFDKVCNFYKGKER